jgi:uncharacterized protein
MAGRSRHGLHGNTGAATRMEAVSRPLPELRNAGAEYWRAAARGTLVIPTCRECSRAFWHPRPRCPHCGSDRVELARSTGTGVVHTFTVVRQSSDPFFKSKVPYVVAMVRLDEGISMMSNIVECDVDAVRIGMPVKVEFEAAAGDIAIPVFRIAT